MFLRFLYNTVPGRLLLKILVHPRVSKLAGLFLSSSLSIWMIPLFIKRHHIDMKNVYIPLYGFQSFNNFFTRKRRERPLPTYGLISPCDGYLSAFRIDEQAVLHVKRSLYSISGLLQDEELAKKFTGGTAFIFRLTPAEYHRFCYTTSGKIEKNRKIQGILHSVRPIALEQFPVFIQNSREYQVLKRENRHLCIQMEVGALLVGKIYNYKIPDDRYVTAGEEKGYFQFGGSTIIVLVPESDNKSLQRSLDKYSEERFVRMGDRLQ